MYKNIAFIGGIHGVGKTTVCEHVCGKLNFRHLSASKIIKWEQINSDPKNKLVKNIPATQDRLVTGLNQVVAKDHLYVLDGHFCLFDKNNEVKPVPLQTFKSISPCFLGLIIGDVQQIKEHLEARDQRLYDYDILSRLQEAELSHAQYISDELGVKLCLGTRSDFSAILNTLKQFRHESTTGH